MLQVGDSVKINSGAYKGSYGVITKIHEPYKKPKILALKNHTHVVEIEPRKVEVRFDPQSLEKTEEVIQHDYSKIEKEKEEIFKVGNLINWIGDNTEIAIAAQVKEVVEIKPHLYEYVLSVSKLGKGQLPPPYEYPLTMRRRSSSFGDLRFKNKLPIVVGRVLDENSSKG